MARLKPEDLKDEQKFEFLAEISHRNMKEFIINQVMEGQNLIRHYAAFQLTMVFIAIVMVIRAIIFWNGGSTGPILMVGLALVISFTLLVIVHELLHALAYILCGAWRVKFRTIFKSFIFYVVADRQVIGPRIFSFVAFAPLVVIQLGTIAGAILFWNQATAFFFLTIMGTHSLFCGGDMAMLSFYKIHPEKVIYNYDDLREGKTYFYFRKPTEQTE